MSEAIEYAKGFGISETERAAVEAMMSRYRLEAHAVEIMESAPRGTLYDQENDDDKLGYTIELPCETEKEPGSLLDDAKWAGRLALKAATSLVEIPTRLISKLIPGTLGEKNAL